MPGCKALTDAEIVDILRYLPSLRDRCFFILALRTGFRVSELLSLKVSDVMQYGAIRSHITVTRANMKGSKASRTVKLHNDAIDAIQAHVRANGLTDGDSLFLSRLKRPMSRRQAWHILKQAFNAARITGKTGTHSCRKSFAARVYEASGKDIRKTQAAIGHKSIASTTSYLAVDAADIDALITSVK